MKILTKSIFKPYHKKIISAQEQIEFISRLNDLINHGFTISEAFRFLVKQTTFRKDIIKEKILTTPPTYGMYAVCAQVNDVGVVKVPLQLDGSEGEGGDSGRFSLRVDEVRTFGVYRVQVSFLTQALDQASGRCRPINQTHLPLLTRKPNWNTDFVVGDTLVTGIRKFQGHCCCR